MNPFIYIKSKKMYLNTADIIKVELSPYTATLTLRSLKVQNEAEGKNTPVYVASNEKIRLDGFEAGMFCNMLDKDTYPIG